MKLTLFTAICALSLFAASCAHKESAEPQHSDVQLTIAALFTQTKVSATAFQSGDMLGLYAVKSGGELNAASNLINNHQIKVSASGEIVGGDSPAYYPDKSSSLDLFSYYPYQSGNATADALGVLVGIRTLQTDFSSLQASDLCYGRKLSAAPTAAAHSLQFIHSFAQLRLNFSLYEGCSAIATVKLLAIKDRAKLNLQTGVVTLLSSSIADVTPFVNSADATNPLQFTAIVPAQTLNGPCVEITLTDGTIYYYHATTPIALKASAANTLNLSLSDKGVLSLVGESAITAWDAATSSGSLGDAVNNLITLYWLAPHTSYATIDKITVSVVDIFNQRREIDVTPTIDPLSSLEYATLTFPLAIAGAGYPQIVENLKLYSGATLLRDSPREAIIGSVLSRAGAHTLGLSSSDYIIINGLKWRKFNVGSTTPEGFGTYHSWAAAPAACISLGDGWRLPTSAEFVALFSNAAISTAWDKCATGNWTTLSSVKGAWAGPGAKSANPATAIFFPAAGIRNDGSLVGVGMHCNYWSSTEYNSDGAYRIHLNTSHAHANSNYFKTDEFTVRCVQ